MVVVEEAIVVFRGLFLERGERRPINKEDVEVPVVVIVDKADARDHRFRLVLVRSWTGVGHEVQARPRGDVFETDGAGVIRLNAKYDGCGNSSDPRYGKEVPKHC